jgi:hypothetical protein
MKRWIKARASRSRVDEADRGEGEGVVGSSGSSRSIGSVANRCRPTVDQREVGVRIDAGRTLLDEIGGDSKQGGLGMMAVGGVPTVGIRPAAARGTWPTAARVWQLGCLCWL